MSNVENSRVQESFFSEEEKMGSEHCKQAASFLFDISSIQTEYECNFFDLDYDLNSYKKFDSELQTKISIYFNNLSKHVKGLSEEEEALLLSKYPFFNKEIVEERCKEFEKILQNNNSSQ